ncbi:hypothetical protein K1T71_011931 [Dendrolimus kikuchii]|uniref:Uncharacterized protein n=1 Tax=Dendrolimus kikuchii TaxID=765133 RepID=A0ACC1CMS1_9NEOP|nr:hypothetical protein K1T71_011931 [Dendrolimus kikuchii]
MDRAGDISELEKNKIGIINKSHKRTKRNKKLNKVTKNGIINSLDEFVQNSTLHGLRYIGDKNLSNIEKCFWLIVVTTSITICGFLIRNVWVKWQNSIIITLNEELVPVDSVYYPSLTICPQIKIRENSFKFEAEREYYQDFMWSGYDETPTERIRLGRVADIALVCDDDLRAGIVNIPISNHTVKINSILDVALDFEDIFESCEWNTNSIACESLFQKVLIRDGVCFTMNALDEDKIIRSENVMSRHFLSNKNYRENLSSVYPIRGSANDATPEFAVTLREYLDYDDKSCKRYSTGFFVYYHDPADMPHASIHSYSVKTNQIMSLALKFDSVSSSEDVKSYPIKTRKCYFPDEPYLIFFLTYTESNCRLECFTNYTKQLCGCVAFYMPRDNATRVCPAHYMYCVDVAQILLYGSLQPKKLERFINMYSYKRDSMNVSLIDKGKELATACACLPICNSVNYNADVMKMDYDFEYYFDFYCTYLEICNNRNKSYTYSKIEWIFKDPSYVGMIRSNMFGVTDFIAQCGGLLGLFLGFSFLTVVEIVYYITLRLGCIIRRENLNVN